MQLCSWCSSGGGRNRPVERQPNSSHSSQLQFFVGFADFSRATVSSPSGAAEAQVRETRLRRIAEIQLECGDRASVQLAQRRENGDLSGRAQRVASCGGGSRAITLWHHGRRQRRAQQAHRADGRDGRRVELGSWLLLLQPPPPAAPCSSCSCSS